MGLGGIKSSENSLTEAQNSFGLQAGQQQQYAANEQAAALNQEASVQVQQSAEEAALLQNQINITAGTQAETFASAGVEQQGTPLSVVNSTRAIGAIQVQAIQQQGAEKAALFRTQANIDQQGGLQDLASAEGQVQINQDQNQLTQQEQTQQALMGWLGLGVQAGGSVLGLFGK